MCGLDSLKLLCLLNELTLAQTHTQSCSGCMFIQCLEDEEKKNFFLLLHTWRRRWERAFDLVFFGNILPQFFVWSTFLQFFL